MRGNKPLLSKATSFGHGGWVMSPLNSLIKDQMLSFERLGIKAIKIKRDLSSLEGIEIAFVSRERPLQAGKLFQSSYIPTSNHISPNK